MKYECTYLTVIHWIVKNITKMIDKDVFIWFVFINMSSFEN